MSRTSNAVRMVIGVMMLSVLPATALGQTKLYLQIPGIAGTSTDSQHLQWIEVDGFGENATPGGGATLVPEPLKIIKHADKSSPKLFVSVLAGDVYPNATLQSVRGDGQLDFEFKLTNVVLKAFSSTGEVTASPKELVSLDFATIDFHYRVYDANGQPAGDITAGWDKVSGKKR